MSDKEMVLETVKQMPETISLDQINEELAILAAIRRGEAAAEAGRVLDHDEVKKRSVLWITQ